MIWHGFIEFGQLQSCHALKQKQGDGKQDNKHLSFVFSEV